MLESNSLYVFTLCHKKLILKNRILSSLGCEWLLCGFQIKRMPE